MPNDQGLGSSTRGCPDHPGGLLRRSAVAWNRSSFTIFPGLARSNDERATISPFATSMKAAALMLSVLIVGCGGGGADTHHTQSQQARPAPSAADIKELHRMAGSTPFACVIAQTGDPEELDTFVSELIDMNMRDNPYAPVTLGLGVGPAPATGKTTLHVFTQWMLVWLTAVNSLNKPTCAPNLGQRRSQATGVTAGPFSGWVGTGFPLDHPDRTFAAWR